jgi:hypothetical protein
MSFFAIDGDIAHPTVPVRGRARIGSASRRTHDDPAAVAQDQRHRRREAARSRSIRYAADVTDRAVRLDVLSMLVLSESRGLIRHHVNVLSAWSGEVGL